MMRENEFNHCIQNGLEDVNEHDVSLDVSLDASLDVREAEENQDVRVDVSLEENQDVHVEESLEESLDVPVADRHVVNAVNRKNK